MNSLKAIILDDEPKSRKILSDILQRYFSQVELAGVYDNADDAYLAALELKPDLLFLDIAMPYTDGFQFLEKFGNIPFEVIFITAHDEYAIKAIRTSALDYLLKPVSIQELTIAVNKAAQRISERTSGKQYDMLLKNMNHPQQSLHTHLAIPTAYGLEFIEQRQIISLEADGSYTKLHLPGDKTIVSTRTLKDYEDLLPEAYFFRAHHSHIINTEQIKKYFKGNGGYVVMTNGQSVDIAKRRKPDFLKRFGNA